MVTTLRDNYWILGLRRLAKTVKRRCIACQRQDSRAEEQPVPPLPELRVKEATPFSVVGIDHAGPLYCSDFQGKKFYILLFTCAVVRAVHLELVESLNLKDCVCAIRRFIARRGMPSVIWSDNAKTFIAAHKQLVGMYGPWSLVKRSLVGLEPTSAHTYESEIQRSTTYATPTSPTITRKLQQVDNPAGTWHHFDVKQMLKLSHDIEKPDINVILTSMCLRRIDVKSTTSIRR